jgi:hypothetical protein
LRTAIVVLLVALGGGVALVGDAATFTLAVGVVDASQTEEVECYWQIDTGQHSTIVAMHPKNMSCERMKELKGKRVRLQVVVE